MSFEYTEIDDPTFLATNKERAEEDYLLVRAKTARNVPIEKWDPPAYCFTTRFSRYEEDLLDMEVKPDDIWVASYPKSGTTWSQEMVWLICNDLDFERAKAESLRTRFPFVDVSLIHDLPNDESSFERVRAMSSPRFIKTHLPVSMLPNQYWKVRPKTVYISRNIKSVAVSYYHHSKNYFYRGTKEDFIRSFMKDLEFYSPIHSHVIGYHSLENCSNILYLSYEEMKRNLRGTIVKVCDFFGRSYSDEQIDRLCEHLSFDSMRVNKACNYEDKDDQDDAPNGEKAPDDRFIRRGWKDSILSLPKKWLSTSEATDEFGFPEMLPKVPVPTLDQTMAEYLRVLSPIVTPQQLDHTRSVIKHFTAPNGPGTALQQYLLEKRDAVDNWAYYYWLNDMYLDNPLPLPINSNPGMVMPPRKFTTVNDISRFGARLIDHLMLHKEMLDGGGLVQERATSREKNQPLCMAQYYRLLGSCRRPGDPRDSQYLPEQRTDEHVVVCCRNQMYCLPVKAGDRGRLNEDEIASQLLYILNDAPCLTRKPPRIGVLTTAQRPQWAKDRQMLLLEEQNARNIELIEQALVLICIDEPIPLTYNARGFNGSPAGAHYCGGRDESNMAQEMIHGGGSEFNSANRWFDKTMQLIICNDGTWGLCYEHSPSEGIAVVQLLEGILKKIDEMPAEAGNDTAQNHLPPPERLEWIVRPEIDLRMREAARSIDRSIEDLDFYVYRYKPFGKNFIKACQVSPDVFIQLALQLAYFKLYGHLVSTYESASTRRFMLGRVDCIRSASSEALEWAKAMCQGEGANVTLESDKEDDYSAEAANDAKKVTFSIYSRDNLRELFRCAAARQTEVMVQNILGHGIDIHLLGLREASKELNQGTVHDLFTDDCYKIANCFLLSTSQVACSTNSFMGYGPVTPHGYGASYNPHPNEIIFCISAFFSSDKTSASRFARSLQDSLDAMRDLLS